MVFIALANSVLLVILLAIPHVFDSFFAYQIGLYLIYGIAAQGIGYLWGRTGILPLGQAMFFGISAYATARILLHVDGLALQMMLLVGVILILALFAFAFASVVFKGRSDSGPYFSLITLALVMISEQVAGTTVNITGGFNGLNGFDTLAGIDQFGGLYFVIAGAVVFSTVLLMTLDRLPAGLVARAISDNEQRLQLLGFPTHLIKGAAFGLSAALAAIAGILFANHQGIVTPTSTGFLLSANLVIWTAVGGRYHVLGPLLGAVLIGYLSSELRDSFQYWEVLMAVVFILVVLKSPGGLAELIQQMTYRLLPNRPPIERSVEAAPSTCIEKGKATVEFNEVRVKAGPVTILNGIEFAAPSEGILCIIGPNGAGKTSLFNVMTGGLSVTDGTILVDQRSIENRWPFQALERGIGRKMQVPSVFQSLSVAQNLSLAMFAGRARISDFFKPSSYKWRCDLLDQLLLVEGVPLRDRMDEQVSSLAQGHRQFLEFAMAITSEPRILLLDEPCAGLSPDETRLMTRLVRQFQDENGGLVLLIEHDMSIVESLSDEVLVLHQGKVLAHGSFDDIKSDPAVQEVYSGGTK